MATLVTRSIGATAKNAPLTNAEVDNNFINLNSDIDALKQAVLHMSSSKAKAQFGSLSVLELSTTEQVLPFTASTQSTNTSVFEVGSSSITIKQAGTYNFLSTVSFEETTASGAVRNVTFNLRQTSDNALLYSQTASVEISDGNRDVIPFNSLMQVTAVPVTFDINVIASGTGYRIVGFNSILAAEGDSLNSNVLSVAGKTGLVTLVKTDVDLGNVDNTSDADKPVSTATKTALDGKADTTHSHAISDVTNLQTTLDGKQATLVSGTNIKTINGASLLGSGNIATPTTTVNNTLTSTSTTEALSAAQGKVLQDSKAALSHTHTLSQITDFPSAVSATELGYLDGVTSAIQTQLNSKQATLVSGTNIKSINNVTLLGSGNISISVSAAKSYFMSSF